MFVTPVPAIVILVLQLLSVLSAPAHMDSTIHYATTLVLLPPFTAAEYALVVLPSAIPVLLGLSVQFAQVLMGSTTLSATILVLI